MVNNREVKSWHWGVRKRVKWEAQPRPGQQTPILRVAKLEIGAKRVSAVGIKGPDDFEKQIPNHLRPCNEKENGQRKINNPFVSQ